MWRWVLLRGGTGLRTRVLIMLWRDRQQTRSCVHRRLRAAGWLRSLLCWCAQLRDADNLSLVTDDLTKQPTLLAVAAKFPAKDKGSVRLIDNMVLVGAPLQQQQQL